MTPQTILTRTHKCSGRENKKEREACDSPKPSKATCNPEVVKRNKTAATAGRQYGGIQRVSYMSAFRESKHASS